MLMAPRPPLFAGVEFYHPSDCPMRAVPEDLISKGNYGAYLARLGQQGGWTLHQWMYNVPSSPEVSAEIDFS